MGKAINLRRRVSSYFSGSVDLGEKTRALASKIDTIRYIPVSSEIESLLLEANYIKKYIPPYNVRFTDGKAYPMIQITVKNKFPSVLYARKATDPQSLYFGPYPNVGAMRLVVRTIRRIFPFQSVANHPNKVCLYFHLGLCLCPSVFLENAKEYKKNIHHVIEFLNGKSKRVIRDLEKDRDVLSKQEQFEKARGVQKKIDAMKAVTAPSYKPFEYEINPNLTSDLRQDELHQLKHILNENNVPVSYLERIECYDVSNIQGHSVTASMVVFTNGEKDSSQYRKFRIRTLTEGIPNDFAAMEEVLTRRLQHSEWKTPSLIIVDGGKGQISAALKAFKKYNATIPLVGLAKREETIITPDFKEIRLPIHSIALHLIQRIRDEAHRFAITYHRKLRQKYALA